MADPREAYQQAKAELAQEQERKKQAAVKRGENQHRAWLHDLELSKQLLQVFGNLHDIFKANRLSYILDEAEPGKCPHIMLYKQIPGQRAGLLSIVMGAKSKNYSLKSFKREAREDSDGTTYGYKFNLIPLPDNASEAAAEILRLLGKGDLEFEQLWAGDNSMPDRAPRLPEASPDPMPMMLTIMVAIIVSALIIVLITGKLPI